MREEERNKTGREPSSYEIAKAMEVPYEEDIVAIEAVQEPMSLFEPIYEEGGDSILMVDQISDDTICDESWDAHLSLKEGMYRLDDREKMIINKRFFQGKTQMEVAEEI